MWRNILILCTILLSTPITAISRKPTPAAHDGFCADAGRAVTPDMAKSSDRRRPAVARAPALLLQFLGRGDTPMGRRKARLVRHCRRHERSNANSGSRHQEHRTAPPPQPGAPDCFPSLAPVRRPPDRRRVHPSACGEPAFAPTRLLENAAPTRFEISIISPVAPSQ